jgi:CubicO group peptidase (beta-lactamase class C family)
VTLVASKDSRRLSILAHNRGVELVLALLLALVATSAVPPAAIAQSIPRADGIRVPAPNAKGPTDPAELQAWLDEIIPGQLAAYNIPGVTISVVRDGQLLLTKGYGVADVATGQPVSAERTLFHIGSITKLFTWTAVMQLVEQGRLDLHADVNRYLPPGIQIPDTFAAPITLAHLMTHTPGFEDKFSNLFALSPDALAPAETYLVSEMPTRVYAPGEIVAYSNYGAALAGYIVERVSGVPFEQYIKVNILDPLGMQHTTLAQPVPVELAGDAAMGYFAAPNGGMMPVEEYLPFVPAGAMSTTATDIARFMIAHLQNGRLGDVHILKEATAREMHQQQYTSDPSIAGLTYGFMEWRRNNQHIIWHSGGSAVFMSLFMLLPEQNVGLFVSYNAMHAGDARTEFRQAFLDRYYPLSETVRQLVADARERLDLVAGPYREGHWAYTTADRLMFALSRAQVVIPNQDRTVTFRGSRYVEVEPFLFREVDGQTTLVFHTDERGRVTHAFQDFEPHEAYIKMAWYETMGFRLAVLGVCVALFLSALAGWPVAALINRRAGGTGTAECRPRQARRLVMVIVTLYLLFPISAGVAGVVIALKNPLKVMSSFSSMLAVALAFPVAAAVLTIGAAVFTGLAWRDRYWSVWGRIHYSLVTLAAVVFARLLSYWNLLGWRF